MSGMFLGMTYIMAGKPGGPDFGPIVMPMAIFLAVTGIGLQVTAGPLAELREARGATRAGHNPTVAHRLFINSPSCAFRLWGSSR